MTDNAPLVSILIPAYNVQEYISKCLDSVLGQTYTNLEVVVVDDGSTDDTMNILEGYAARDNRVVIVRKKNEGLILARRDGVEAAKGDYVYFLDSDDYIADECIEKMMRNMIGSDCDVVSTPLVRVKGSHSWVIKQHVPQIVEGDMYLEILLAHRIFTSIAGKMYKKKLFANVLFESSISLWEDFYLNLQVALERPKVFFMVEGLYYYVQRGASMNRSYRSLTYVKNFITNLERVMDKHPDVKAKYYSLLLQDKIHWFHIYIKKSRNKWAGDNDFAKSIRNEVRLNKKQLKKYVPTLKINSILFYRRRVLYPLVLMLSMFDRMHQSARRRKT